MNLHLLTADELVKYFQPATERERILHSALSHTVLAGNLAHEEALEQMEKDALEIEADNEKLREKVKELEAELDEATV